MLVSIFLLTSYFYLSQSFVKLSPKECPENSYFDISHLDCKPCNEEGNTPAADRLSCTCQKNFKKVSDKGAAFVKCEACPANQVATKDGWICAQCESGCETCPNQEISNIRSTLGVQEPVIKCAQCTGNTAPAHQGDHCVPCNPSILGDGCICKSPNVTSGGLCFDAKELAEIPDSPSLYTVAYQGNVRLDSSWYFKDNLRAAVTMCKLKNMTACQVLGNLCVLLHYNLDSSRRGGEGACDHYQKLASVGGQQIEWPENMPQLYYRQNDVNLEQLRRTDIRVPYSFSPESPMSQLQIVVASYALNGTFLGLVPATRGLLQLCKNEEKILDAAYKFGRKYRQTCQINVRSLWNNHELIFYDPYLQYPINPNDKTYQLYPLPVVNLNIESNGALQNTADEIHALTRRIFLVDNISGKDNANSSAKIVRYPEYISLNVELRTTRDGLIYPPFLKIKYNEVKLEAYEQNGNVMVTFETVYFMSTQRHEKDIEITMATLCSMAVLWAAVKTWSWSRRSGKAAVDFVTILKGIIFLGVSIANVFLVVLVMMCFWMLVLYKRQRTPVLMMPTWDQEYSFTVYFGLATAIKIIEMIHLLIIQVTTQVFFIDWERPRGFIIPRHGETSNVAQTKTPAPVTIWRTYFVANEWNELQNYRKTSHIFQLMAMLFFLKVLNFEALALIEPDSTMYNVPKEYQDSRMSRFAVASVTYFAIGFFQWFVNVFIVERCVSDHFRSFIDVCSISNVSVLCLLHRQFGYYIHGRSVHGHGDADMKELNEMLQRERDNLCSQRGLEPNTDQQCFIACFPLKFRQQFDRVLSPLRSPNRAEVRLTGTDQATVRTGGLIEVYDQMNQFLTSFIDHVAVEADYIIKDRTFLESVFDMEFQDTNQKGVFYKVSDPSDSSFARALTYGNEYTQLTFDLCLFCMIDMIAHNFIIAAVVSYLILTMIKMFRKTGVRKNLTKTSLVDERFLI